MSAACLSDATFGRRRASRACAARPLASGLPYGSISASVTDDDPLHSGVLRACDALCPALAAAATPGRARDADLLAPLGHQVRPRGHGAAAALYALGPGAVGPHHVLPREYRGA